ncbi:MAG: HAD hydrolase-like protein, partial [Lentisphaeria bacterium]|nr:HAD hydrolase-like protein [Lentisphaeria bacterium]
MNRCIIYDLDGTLADTVKDIANSVNLTRQDYNLEQLPLDQIVSMTGDGAKKLLERAFSDHPINIEEGVLKMIDHYYDYPVVHTVLYPGVAEGLAILKDAGWKQAVLTNKPGKVAREILKRLGISEILDDIIGGNDGYPLKPDPTAVLYLADKYQAEIGASWVLGDNHTDMNSARNSGMNGAFAEWGFGFLGDAQCDVRFKNYSEFV